MGMGSIKAVANVREREREKGVSLNENATSNKCVSVRLVQEDCH